MPLCVINIITERKLYEFGSCNVFLPEKVLIAYGHSRKRKFSLVSDLHIDGFSILEVEDDARNHEGEEKGESCRHGKAPNSPGIKHGIICCSVTHPRMATSAEFDIKPICQPKSENFLGRSKVSFTHNCNLDYLPCNHV